jgi:hypothetical protein
MKIIEHEASGKPESMTLGFNPMVVWLNRRIELRIEKGDQLRLIVPVVLQHWNHLKPGDVASVVAFWFAVGERLAAKKKLGNWKAAELIVNAKRRYLFRA